MVVVVSKLMLLNRGQLYDNYQPYTLVYCGNSGQTLTLEILSIIPRIILIFAKKATHHTLTLTRRSHDFKLVLFRCQNDVLKALHK